MVSGSIQGRLLLLIALVVIGCNRNADGPTAGARIAYIEKCSPVEFTLIARRYAGRIDLATPRDQVVRILADFATEIHDSHRPDIKCQYLETVYRENKQPLFSIAPPERRSAPQIFRAKILSSDRVCVNYDDHVVSSDSEQYESFSWSWRSKKDAIEFGTQRVFDPVCFSFSQSRRH